MRKHKKQTHLRTQSRIHTENPKLEAKYTHQELCPCCFSLCEFTSFNRVDLEGLFLMSSIPSGSYTIPTSSAVRFLRHEERDLMETSHLGFSVSRSLTLYRISVCKSLYSLPSAKEESFTDDG